jgi:uncharacterized tellurite resistance protein B-like protein
MSLNDDLEELFRDAEKPIVSVPLRFKAKLGIGERAYRSLRTRENLRTLTETVGAGSAAAGLASSGVVAGTFFASKGIWGSALTALGLGTAVTPIGWVIAAGVLTGGVYFGVSRLLESPKDHGVVVVPKYISTPLDLIAVALADFMVPLSLKIAQADGELDEREARRIQSFYCEQWGYSPEFISRLLGEYRSKLDSISYSTLSSSLTSYCDGNKDCDREIIMIGLLTHLREVAEADGVIREAEEREIEELAQLLGAQLEDTRAVEKVSGYFQSTATSTRKSSARASGYVGRLSQRLFSRGKH